MVLRGGSSKVPACTGALVTLAGAKPRRAGGMSSRSYSVPAPAVEGATFDALDASADEMRIDGKGEKKTQSVWTHDCSHLSQSWLPLSVAPPARQAQLHVAPARSTAQRSLLACNLANTALCAPVRLSAPFGLCRCLNGKLWVTTSSVAQAGDRQQSCRISGRGSYEMDNAMSGYVRRR